VLVGIRSDYSFHILWAEYLSDICNNPVKLCSLLFILYILRSAEGITDSHVTVINDYLPD
jgi:hypothetical protein